MTKIVLISELVCRTVGSEVRYSDLKLGDFLLKFRVVGGQAIQCENVREIFFFSPRIPKYFLK